MNLITVEDLPELDVAALSEPVGVSAYCGGEAIAVVIPWADFKRFEQVQTAMEEAIKTSPLSKQLLAHMGRKLLARHPLRIK